eukprot:11480929-Alexandrium_andersonii.AAC.1
MCIRDSQLCKDVTRCVCLHAECDPTPSIRVGTLTCVQDVHTSAFALQTGGVQLGFLNTPRQDNSTQP